MDSSTSSISSSFSCCCIFMLIIIFPYLIPNEHIRTIVVHHRNKITGGDGFSSEFDSTSSE